MRVAVTATAVAAAEAATGILCNFYHTILITAGAAFFFRSIFG